MIPTSDPRTSALPHGESHARAVRQPEEAEGAQRVRAIDHGAQLAEMVADLRSLQEHVGTDRRLNERIRDAAVRLEALAVALGRTPVIGPTQLPGTSATAAVPRPALADLEAAFLRWLTDPVTGEELRLDEDDGSPRPMRQVLQALSSSTHRLPDDAASSLGMPAGTTVGHAVSELRLAVDDPSGPQCRSYRAAAYYLRGLDRVALATAELERASR